MTNRLALALVVAILPALAACSGAASSKKGNDLAGDDESGGNEKGSGKKTAPEGDTSSGPTNTPTPAPTTPVTPPASPPADPLVYAHTADTLYTWASAEKKLTEVGKLACLPANDRLLDIAVDAKGTIFGASDHAFVAINPKDATCTRIVAKEGLPNSLSFVPTGTLDAAVESLVGYAFDASGKAVTYVKIATDTGAMTTVGTLNPSGASKKYVSSGDIFSVANAGNKAYLTVHEDTTTTGPDMLAEIDPKTGTIVRIVGNTLQPDIWGLAYWGGKAYGFAGDGTVTEINVTTGVANVVTTLKDGGNAIPWFGAGVTTQAPTTK